MDILFSTRYSGKSSHLHTCCRLFVTDNGFIYVVTNKSKKEFKQAPKKCAKYIGATDAIVSDTAPDHKS